VLWLNGQIYPFDQSSQEWHAAKSSWRPRQGDGPACKPDSVIGDHPSRATVAGGLQRPTRVLGRATLERTLSGLAPGGVCRAATVTRRTGGLLPHRFTLTAPGGAAVCFLWHCPASHLGWVLPTTLLCGVRTFLEVAPRDRPAGPSVVQPIRSWPRALIHKAASARGARAARQPRACSRRRAPARAWTPGHTRSRYAPSTCVASASASVSCRRRSWASWTWRCGCTWHCEE
jgi:hypothetical protein